MKRREKNPAMNRMDGTGLAFSIVVSRFNGLVTESLLQGAVDALCRHGVAEENIAIYRVPGSFEIPFTIRTLLRSGKAGDGIIALGAILRGETSHYNVIAAEVSRGIAQLTLESEVPIAFGVLTADTLEQAMERAGGKMGNKGAEAALVCLEMIHLSRSIRQK